MPLSEYVSVIVADYLNNTTSPPGGLLTTRYIALHTANPTKSCLISEISGDGYSRTALTFEVIDTTNGRTLRNNTVVVFPTGLATKGTAISHFSIWDSQTAGIPVAYGALSAPATWEIGKSLSLAINAVVITIHNVIV